MSTKPPVSILAKVEVDVSGLEALSSEAKKRNVTIHGARAAGKVLLPAARAGAPKRPGSGALRRAQGVLVKKGTRSGTTASFAVQGARKKVDRMIVVRGRKKAQRVVPAFYDHLVQLGTRPHALGKGESLGRDATKRRKAIVRTGQGSGKHPGAKKNPYRERAWGAVSARAGTAALAAMDVALVKEIAKQSARLAAKLKGK